MRYGVLPVVLLALAGCGGGSDGSPTTTAESGISDRTPTKQDYLARGDAICADAQADLARLGPEIERASTAPEDEQPELVRDVWREQVRILDRFSTKIKQLGAPPGDEARVREFVRSLDDGERLGGEIVGYLEDGEAPPQSLMNRYAQVAYRGNALAQAYGFKVCGRTRD
jgi:hypothetical protein